MFLHTFLAKRFQHIPLICDLASVQLILQQASGLSLVLQRLSILVQ